MKLEKGLSLVSKSNKIPLEIRALDQLTCGIAQLAIDGTVLFANKALQPFFNRNELGSASFRFPEDFNKSVDPAFASRLREAFQSAILGEKSSVEAEFKIPEYSEFSRTQTERIVFLKLTLTPLETSSEVLLEVLDQTTLKNTEERLKADDERSALLEREKKARSDAENANQAKDYFLATLSHELRTPVTAILSWAQLLRLGTLSLANTQRAYEAIEQNAKNQGKLINDLLDVSKIILGKLPLELQEINPADLIITTLNSVRPMLESKSITVHTDFEPLNGIIIADPARFQQILWNLLVNAIKFSFRNSTITIRLQCLTLRNEMKISVVDHGIGIPAEFLPRLFDPFSQVDGSSTRKYGGLGLGLAIVSNLVRLQKGTIQAESEGKDKGATFTLTFPLQPHERALPRRSLLRLASPKSYTLKEITASLKGLRLLFVDDEKGTCEVFDEMMKSFGVHVLTASSAQEALHALREFKPDALVSDIAMPAEDGYSLIRKVRTLRPEEGGKTPAIALTAYAGPENAQRALAAGFQAHIAKPVEVAQLAQVIRHLTVSKRGS